MHAQTRTRTRACASNPIHTQTGQRASRGPSAARVCLWRCRLCAHTAPRTCGATCSPHTRDRRQAKDAPCRAMRGMAHAIIILHLVSGRVAAPGRDVKWMESGVGVARRGNPSVLCQLTNNCKLDAETSLTRPKFGVTTGPLADTGPREEKFCDPSPA